MYFLFTPKKINPVPHSRHRLVVADPSPQSIYCGLQFTKIVKLLPKVENEISNIVHVHCIVHLLKARTRWILAFLPKSLFSKIFLNYLAVFLAMEGHKMKSFYSGLKMGSVCCCCCCCFFFLGGGELTSGV